MESRYRQSVTDLGVNQLADIINFIPDAVLAIDLEGRVIIWNKAMEEMTGFMAENMIGRGNYEYAIPFYGFRRPILVDLVRKPNQKFDGEYKNLQRVGDTLIGEVFIPSFDISGPYIWAKAAPLYDSAGNVIGAIESIRDITKRRLADEKLARQNALLKSVIESPMNVISFSLDRNYCYISFNEAHRQTMKAIWGVDISLGMNMLDVIGYPEDREKAKINFDKVLSGEHFTVAEQYGDEALSRKYWDDIYSPITDDQGEIIGITVFCIDITERKRAEEALREQLNFLQQLIDAMSNPVFFKDTNGIYLGCNKAFETMTGFTKGEVVGKSVYDLYPKDIADIYFEADNKLFKDPGVQVYDASMIHSDGSRSEVMLNKATYFDTDGRLSGLVGVIQDITERKNIENAIRESKRRLADIINFLPDATLVVDKEGKVIAWNRAIEALTGVKAEDMLGKDNYEHALPFYGQRRPILIDLVLMPQEEIEKNYSSLRREDGTLVGEAYMPMLGSGSVYLWGVASALYDSKGNIVGAIESIRDITERKSSEEVLTASLHEKEVLLKEVHHRVKNNLQIVTSLLRLQSMSVQDKEALEAFKDSQNRIKSMALVHEKLYGSDDLSRVHINDYINKLAFDLVRSFGSEKQVTFYFDLEDVFLGIDKAIPFGLILNELITNCLKHAFPRDRKGKIHVGLNLDDNRLDLIVCDNGIGMSKDIEIGKIKSTGLMLVQALVKQLKGTLDIIVDGGTKFKISIEI